MDPHTARCLQLSTNIRMPFHPYRPTRFPDSVNRPRFPISTPNAQVRPGPQRASSMPPNPWQGSVTPNATYPPSLTPASSLNGCSPQSYQISPATDTPTMTPSSAVDGSYFSASGSHFGVDPWESAFKIDTKSARNEGLGMSFFSQDDDFGPVTYSATNEEFDDLIRLNENEPWDLSNPMSPDRQSLSSSSSGDGVSDFTDFSEMCPLPNLNTDLSGLEMPIVEEDAPADFAPTRRGRSVSRAPISRASSNRRYRRTPYGADHARSSSVMSTSSNMSAMAVSLPPTQCCSPVEECHDDFMVDDFKNFSAGMTNSSMLHGSSFHGNNGDFNSFYSAEQLVAPKPMYSCDTLFLSSTFDDSMFDNPVPNVLPSSDLSSEHVNGARDGLRSFADEPDLFGPLSEEPSVPSEEDMKPEDSEMEPSVQELRFEGDLYTPKFVRGHGNKREGYCGLCKPGRWLVLKNSAFWYDKSFTHGISAATGQPFDAPKETRRMSGNPDVWEGLCGTCGEWIALISNKKKGTTWFRHAYKCHTHQKAKDAPKKRRDMAQSKSQKSKSSKEEGPSNSANEAASDVVQVEHAPRNNGAALQTITSLV